MRALIFDCETSGLVPNRTITDGKLPEIVEFCGFLVNLPEGIVIDEVDTLIKPTRGIDERSKAAEATGITNDMVRDAPTFRQAFPRIRAIIEAAPMAIAHNATFDQEMIDIEAKRIGESIRWPRLMCTVEQTMHLKGVRLPLSDLHELLFGLKFAGAHRARVDVEALVRCVAELMKRDVL